MIARSLPDVNVWFALSRTGHVHHKDAHTWLRGVDRTDSVFFCRATQQGHLRLLTTEVVMRAYGAEPLANDQAWEASTAWLRDPRIAFMDEPATLQQEWQRFGCVRTVSPKLWMDAYFAAFARAADLQLVTTDKAFKQFKGLDLHLLG